MTETVYATDVQLSWEKSTPCIKSGFKNGKVPHGAVAGDNGTFIITTPSTLNLRICLENEDVYTRDIMSLVKDVTGWKRLSLTWNCVSALRQTGKDSYRLNKTVN